MNHLNEKNSVLNRPMYLCLCPVCLGQFLDTGIYKIVRENHGQAKERCDFCNYRKGTISSSTPKRKRKMRWQTNGNEKV